MKILGLSFDYHNSAAALIVDGEIIAAIDEERLSRVKNDPSLPVNAINACFELAGLDAQQIDAVVFYENALERFSRIVWSAMGEDREDKEWLEMASSEWIALGKLYPQERLAETLGIPENRIFQVNHHDSHLASAYYCSGFEEATIISLDGLGEYDCGAIGAAEGRTISRLKTQPFPHSLGLFYSAFTSFLGFKVNDGEYKVMGFSGYGIPKYWEEMFSWFHFEDDGTFTLDQKYFNFFTPKIAAYSNELVKRFGPPRSPNKNTRWSKDIWKLFEQDNRENRDFDGDEIYADIAASVQRCTEEVILAVADRAIQLTGKKKLCMAGGVALNSVANGRLKRERPWPLFVQPNAGDAGSALGAALDFHAKNTELPVPKFSTPYLGLSIDREELESAISRYGIADWQKFDDQSTLTSEVARRLANGEICGWVQGRFEWGPRALGRRSILADPRSRNTVDVVNSRIKFRESFRPFAPSVTVEAANTFFDLPGPILDHDTETYMLAVHPVRPEAVDRIAAVTHVDGSARIQVVSEQRNPVYWQLIQQFGTQTGVPVLLNTSFNLKDEPIVNTAKDAIATFIYSDLDFLVIDNCIINRDYRL
ncbi:carbamoyltransferase [Roseibium sp.]|uniref:carbamoyltransferase family protein n=1 Tax=Roseibium sp. TaxID=1936156 RepID=UPI003BB2036C